MCRYILVFIYLLLPIFQVSAESSRLMESLQSLDVLLTRNSEFTKVKEDRIAKLKTDLALCNNNQEQRYQNCIRLYEEYKAYQYDSAFHYAQHSFDLAVHLCNLEYQLESKCAIIFCLLSAGLFKEAFEELHAINYEDVDNSYKKIFYSLAVRLNYAISDYNRNTIFCQKYIEKGSFLTDSLLKYSEQNTWESDYYMAQREMKLRDYLNSIALFEKLLLRDDLDIHTKAIVHSCVGWMYWQNGNEESGLINLAESAKCDIIASIKETTSLCALAELLYERGDIKRANNYIQYSLENANFYGARHRKIEVNNILPIIEQKRYLLLQQQRNIILIGVTIISLLVFALTYVLFVLLRQKRKIEDARLQIIEHNKRLKEVNMQLKEVNRIKNEYIGNSFYQSAQFIDKIEKVYKTVTIKIAARQYNDVDFYLKNTMIREERNNMFEIFDKTFLRIFPNFVQEYNNLFPDSERRYPLQTDSLTTEMRIFALIRLGVTENERIAQFLNKSIHTIHTYKTRIKNKSLVENEKFEEQIMKIGRYSDC